MRHLLLPTLMLLAACSGNAVVEIAEREGYSSRTLTGEAFLHQLYSNDREGQVLHVYIEGDGRPWRTQRQVSADPTPANPMMLRLMAGDASPAVYLGRPCYFSLADPRCSPRWWTDGRYSEQVVASMNGAIDRLAQPYRSIVIFGHSGGGTLAMLLAARRQDVIGVVTLAGNLDVDAWTRHHGYTPLEGSLSPYTQPSLDAGIRQLHLIGERDEVVTVTMLTRAIQRQVSAELRIVERADHACCWAREWPGVLLQVDEWAMPPEAVSVQP